MRIYGKIWNFGMLNVAGIAMPTRQVFPKPRVVGMKTYHYFCIMGVIEYIAARKYDAWMQKKAEEKASLV